MALLSVPTIQRKVGERFRLAALDFTDRHFQMSEILS
jgi:hypothetical protein